MGTHPLDYLPVPAGVKKRREGVQGSTTAYL